MADDEKIELKGDDARAGTASHVTRYVLGISLVAIVLIFAIVLIISYR